MTRALYEDIELFIKRVRKYHPGTKGIVIGLAFPSSHIVLTSGDLKGHKAGFCRSISAHENAPLDDHQRDESKPASPT